VLTSKLNNITFFLTTWSKLTVGPLYVEYLDMTSGCCVLREILSFSTFNHL
jgi:hypothetical protein